METIDFVEEEQEIAQNQIAFDFDHLPEPEIEDEEESSSLTDTAFLKKNFEWITKDVLFVVVKCDSDNRYSSYNLDLCGRPMIDWVVMAGSGCETRIINDNENIIEVLKSIKTEKPYICVLYSNTPLVTKTLVYKIMDYFVRNRLNALSLIRGYVFKTDFLASIDKFMSAYVEEFDKTAFTIVNDGESYLSADNILQRRIINFHERNGVLIFDKKTVVIDADVEIDEGVIIKPYNILKGNTIIGKNAFIQENNVISNSVIGENCVLLACQIVDSNISSGKKLITKTIENAKI